MDMAGWVSYQIGLLNFKFKAKPVHSFVEQAVRDFESRGKWILIFAVTRENLEGWFRNEQNTERSQRFVNQWREQMARKAK